MSMINEHIFRGMRATSACNRTNGRGRLQQRAPSMRWPGTLDRLSPTMAIPCLTRC